MLNMTLSRGSFTVVHNRLAIIIRDSPLSRSKLLIKFKNTPHKNFVGAEIIINWFMSPRKKYTNS